MRSPIPWLVVLVVIGLILLAALTFPAPGMAAITGKYTPTAAPRAVDHPFGVEFMGGITQAATSPDIQAIHDVGASWVRVAIYWARLQPREDSTIDWTSVDAGFRRLARLGLHPIVVIRDIPSWAAMEHPTLHDRPSCGPVRSDKMDAYLDFVATLVRRYSGPPFNVKYWEIYNEPDKIYSVRPDIDIGGCFGDIWYDEYVRILRDVYRTVKEIDPQAVIAFGGVAHDWFYYPGTPYPHSGLFDPYFLDEVIDKRRGGDWFDVMNFHTYYAWRWYWEYYGYGKDVLAKYNYMREQLRQYGYPDKPIIITETGMRSYDANHPELVSERTQARYVLRLFARILTVMYDQPFVWFSIRDIGHSHGLLREDGSEKPSYRVYRFGVPQFTGARFLGMTGDYGNTIEGYRYEKEGHEFWVLWYKDGPSYTYRNISIPWTRVRVTDMFGEEQRVIVDGGTGDLDGQVNGRITLPIPHDPVYLDSPDGPIGAVQVHGVVRDGQGDAPVDLAVQVPRPPVHDDPLFLAEHVRHPYPSPGDGDVPVGVGGAVLVPEDPKLVTLLFVPVPLDGVAVIPGHAQETGSGELGDAKAVDAVGGFFTAVLPQEAMRVSYVPDGEPDEGLVVHDGEDAGEEAEDVPGLGALGDELRVVGVVAAHPRLGDDDGFVRVPVLAQLFPHVVVLGQDVLAVAVVLPVPAPGVVGVEVHDVEPVPTPAFVDDFVEEVGVEEAAVGIGGAGVVEPVMGHAAKGDDGLGVDLLDGAIHVPQDADVFVVPDVPKAAADVDVRPHAVDLVRFVVDFPVLHVEGGTAVPPHEGGDEVEIGVHLVRPHGATGGTVVQGGMLHRGPGGDVPDDDDGV